MDLPKSYTERAYVIYTRSCSSTSMNKYIKLNQKQGLQREESSALLQSRHPMSFKIKLETCYPTQR